MSARVAVAVVTRTKDRPLLLERAIESVLGQTMTDWVHVIVNDGGDPAVVDTLVAQYAARYRGRVQVIHHGDSVGMQAASNRAIEASDSEYLVIHDDDDSWAPQFLEQAVAYLEARGVDDQEQGVAVQSAWIREELDSHGRIVELSRQDYYPFESVSLFKAMTHNPFPPIAFLYRRRVHEQIGLFDQTFNELGDWDFVLRFLSRYEIGVIDRQLARYHWRHQAGASGYGNTVTDGKASHQKKLVRLQNQYLRQDLACGQTGLGFLVNLAGGLKDHVAWLSGLQQRSDQVAHTTLKTLNTIQYYERILENVVMPWKSQWLPKRAFDRVADWVNGTRRPTPSNGAPPPAILADQIQRAAAVSLDVFDTTLLRLVRKPTDVFLLMQEEARRLLDQPALRFVDLRIQAEQESREHLRPAGWAGETTLEEIYKALQRATGCSDDVRDKLQQLELETEHRVLYPNPLIATALQGSIGKHRRLVFSSDMYLPSREIHRLLERHGYPDPRLLLSADHRTTKHDGGLYERVIEELDRNPSEILHIGDNHHSDVDRARQRGLKAIHWKADEARTPLVDQRVSYSGEWEGDLASSLYTGLVRRRRLEQPLTKGDATAFWEMIGYEVMGPLYLSFVCWAIDRATARGLNKLFFLARDGYHLVRVFERLQAAGATNIKADYLYASRRLWNVARIRQIDEQALQFLVTPNPRMRVRDFFRRIGLDPQAQARLVRQTRFTGLDEPVTTRDGVFRSGDAHQDMRWLMEQCADQIIARAGQEREQLLRYFGDMGLGGDTVGIVDIGWQASSLRSLHDLLEDSNKECRVPGFYFGTWRFARPAIEAGQQFESFFMHLDEPSHRSWIVGEAVELVETFFWAPHPTIIGLRKEPSGWEPVYGEPELETADEQRLRTASAAALRFIDDALAAWPEISRLDPPYGYLETTLERLLRYPQPDEAAILGGLGLRSSFGGHGPLRHVAQLPSATRFVLDRKAYQDAYDHCYWKKGFAAQLTPRTRKYLKMR